MAELQTNSVGAVWVKTAKNGKEYLGITIKINGHNRQYVAFENHKSKPSHPDYRIFESLKKEAQKPEPRPGYEDKEEPFPF